MTTNTVAIIRKNQQHLMDWVWEMMRGEAGVRTKADAFVKWVEWYIDEGHPTPYSAIASRIAGGEFLIYTSDIRKYLHSLGLTDDYRLDGYTFRYYDYGWDEMSGPMGLYMALLSRDGNNLYRSLKKGKNPLAVKKKKKTVRRV